MVISKSPYSCLELPSNTSQNSPAEGRVAVVEPQSLKPSPLSAIITAPVSDGHSECTDRCESNVVLLLHVVASRITPSSTTTRKFRSGPLALDVISFSYPSVVPRIVSPHLTTV